MGKIDTSEWKEFRIGDYFKVEYGRFHAKDELGTGTVNYITTSGFNNGITNTCEEATHQGNCITVASDGAMGASFYQEEAFTTSNIVSTLTPLPHTPLNKYNALFLCAIIFGKRAEFGWLGFKMSVDRVRNLRVKLPSTPNGDPDWAYMESYMANLETKVAESLTLLQAAKDAEKKKVDTMEWGEFRVGELFDIKRPAARSEKKYCEGEINYVSSGAFNNGVANKLMPLPNELLDRGGCITVSPLDGSSFYQEEDFLGRGGSGASISILYNSHLNRNNALFICSVIRSSANGFGYTDLLNGENLKSLTIKLPMDKTGQPDWGYMEEYTRKVEERVKATMGKLEKKCYVS